MASSNRHWPSMFKSKPCHQWQHDINSSLVSNGSHKSSIDSGCEGRSAPEPKPRWNPRPEQIRILEAIFNSGMVNPPREEIKKIRAQLQEYGQVGDANVFYWFQNRKSRSKHKLRQLQNKTIENQQNPAAITSISATTGARTRTPPSSSSSSSDKSSYNSTDKSFSVCSYKSIMDVRNSPTTSVNQQSFLQARHEFFPEPFFFPMQQNSSAANLTNFTQGLCFPDTSNSTQVVNQENAPCPSLFFSDLQGMNSYGSQKKVVGDDEKIKLQEQLLCYPFATTPTTVVPPTSIPIPSTIHQLQGGIESGDIFGTKSTVFINEVAFEVAVGPFNVREAFGDDAMLIHSSGLPVLTNEWGVTLHPLQHGAFYFLLRTFSPSHHDHTTIDLI